MKLAQTVALPRTNMLAFWLILAAAFLAVVGGAFVALLPWIYVIVVLLLPLLLVLTILFPEFGIVALLFLVYGLVPAALTPQLSVGPGNLKSYELALLMLFCLMLAKMINAPSITNVKSWLRPLFLIIALTMSGIVVGRLLYGSSAKDILNDARVQMSWLVALLIIYLVDTRGRLNRLLWGLVLLGVALSVAVVAQFVTGKSYIQDARVEGLMTLTTTYSDITRSTAGGGIYLIVFPILFVLARLLTKSISWVVALPILGILVSGVVVSFGRGIWISTAVVCLVLAYGLRRWSGIGYIVIAMVIGITAALGGLATYKPAVLEAAYERLLSTTKEGDKNSSLGWRFEEMRYASERLLRSPVVGIGYGTAYKPFIKLTGDDTDYILMRYSHNGYLGIWLKLGLAGVFAVLWFSWNTVRKGLSFDEKCFRPTLESCGCRTRCWLLDSSNHFGYAARVARAYGHHVLCDGSRGPCRYRSSAGQGHGDGPAIP